MALSNYSYLILIIQNHFKQFSCKCFKSQCNNKVYSFYTLSQTDLFLQKVHIYFWNEAFSSLWHFPTEGRVANNWDLSYKMYHNKIYFLSFKKIIKQLLPDSERLEVLGGAAAAGLRLWGAGAGFRGGVGDGLGCATAPVGDTGDLASGRLLGWTEGGEGSTGIAPGAGGFLPGDSKFLGTGIGDLLGEEISLPFKLGDGGEGADGETTSKQRK